MVSIRLQQVCGKYVSIIKRIERVAYSMYEEDISALECERVKWHNVVMDALDAEGIQYTDRNGATDIAYNIALGRYS